MNIHPLVQFVIVVWFFAAVGAAFTKDADVFSYAMWVTLAAGAGYLILRYNHC